MSLENEIRLGLRAQLLAGGVPPHHVDEITDLAVHSAFSAKNAMFDVLRRSSGAHIWLSAIGPAIGIAKSLLDIMEDNVKRKAAEDGMPVRPVELTVGGPQ